MRSYLYSSYQKFIHFFPESSWLAKPNGYVIFPQMAWFLSKRFPLSLHSTRQIYIKWKFLNKQKTHLRSKAWTLLLQEITHIYSRIMKTRMRANAICWFNAKHFLLGIIWLKPNFKTCSGRKADKCILKQWFPSTFEMCLGFSGHQQWCKIFHKTKLILHLFYLKNIYK